MGDKKQRPVDSTRGDAWLKSGRVLFVRRFPRLCALALLSLLPHVAGPARAQVPAARRSGSKDVAELVQRVRAGHEDLAAIDALAALPGRAATDALSALLFEGLPDASTDRILQDFAERPRPSAFDALERMAGHRRAQVRVGALRAIATVAAHDAKLDARASELLAAGLRDSDAAVRGVAASALGARYERLDAALSGAMPRDSARPAKARDAAVRDLLLRALARGVPEAARAAGFATPEAELPKLYAALAGQPLTATLDACDAALARKGLSETAKLEVIARIGEIATPATKAFLAGLIAQRRFPMTSRIQRALVETEKRIEVNPGQVGGTR